MGERQHVLSGREILARADHTMDASEVAQALGVSQSSVYNGLRSGELALKYVRVGKRYRILTASVEQLLDVEIVRNGETASKTPRSSGVSRTTTGPAVKQLGPTDRREA